MLPCFLLVPNETLVLKILWRFCEVWHSNGGVFYCQLNFCLHLCLYREYMLSRDTVRPEALCTQRQGRRKGVQIWWKNVTAKGHF